MSGRVCSVEGCEKPVIGRGLCNMHWKRMRKYGTADLPVREPASCAAPGCDHPAVSRGMCQRHYRRMKTFGRFDLPTEVDRFWTKVDKRGDCWEWRGCVNNKGYGQFSTGDRAHRKLILPHRYSYELSYGTIPPGLFVLHRCDNPRCVRPDHLFLGTNLDNMADMRRKGRSRFGERHPLAKLTMAQVALIRERHAAGETSARLAQAFQVTPSTINNIVVRRSWKAA